MRFLCLGYFDVDRFDRLSEGEKDGIMEACDAQCVPFRETGKVVEEEALKSPRLTKTVRPRNGRPFVTDGPFIETREQIGSFFIVEADDVEGAVQVASLHPAAMMGEEHGFGIEIRPIE